MVLHSATERRQSNLFATPAPQGVDHDADGVFNLASDEANSACYCPHHWLRPGFALTTI
jgi:hypothetical protein